MLRTCFFFVTFIPWTIFIILTGVPLSFLSPDYLHNYGRLWARVGLRLAGIRFSVSGQENLPSGRPVIFMPNHQSNFDILALYAGLPGQFRWLAKEELFRVPLFGLAMRRSGYIPVDRSDRRKAMASMTQAAKRISEGASVIIFPEGTRSPDGRLLPFKKGGFILACQARALIVPVAIKGSGRVMAKHSRRIHGGAIHVSILSAISTENRKAEDRNALIELVRRPLAVALEKP